MNKSLKPYLLLWSTQTISALGSGMTAFALTLWLYQKNGSALETALLSVCSYAPYVVMSIFAGALSDRWSKKKTMLCCDMLAAVSTLTVLMLLKTDLLQGWHLYILNALSGLMNTVQQPAAEVASTLLIPREYYQKTSGLRSFSQSLNTILTPVLASMLFAFGGMDVVIFVDLATFALAFLTLLLLVKIPELPAPQEKQEKLLQSAEIGLRWLRENPLILSLILFLASVNLIASAFDAALPALILPRENGGEQVLGVVNAFAGVATLLGSLLAMVWPKPKNRVRIIWVTILISFGTENLLMAFGHTPVLWCIGQILGWLPIPLMSAQMDVIFRSTIPTEMQGRVYACRNTLQFFTIPVGFLLSGLLIDEVFEPWLATSSLTAFGTGKGAGAAAMMFLLWVLGVTMVLAFAEILHRNTERSKS